MQVLHNIVKLEEKQTELECLIEYFKNNNKEYIAHSTEQRIGIYYFALKYKEIITCTIVSMNSYKGEREEGWIYFKELYEETEPIYIKPTKKLFKTLTNDIKDFNYSWRYQVKQILNL